MKTLCAMMLLIALIIGGMPTAPVYGGLLADDDQRVFDYAGLFSAPEIARLNRVARSHTLQYLQDIVIITAKDAQGKSAMNFAEDFYNYNGFGVGPGYDGILLLIDMDNREIFIRPAGSAVNVFNDVRINAMLNNIYNHVASGAYAKGAGAFLNDVESCLSQPKATAASRYWSWDFFGLGFCAVIIILGAMITRHKRGLLAAHSARDYINDEACNLSDSQDIFLHRDIRRVSIKSDSNSDGSSAAGSSSRTRYTSSDSNSPRAANTKTSAPSRSSARPSASGRTRDGGRNIK